MLVTHKIELRIELNYNIKSIYIKSTYSNNYRLWRKTHSNDRRN